MNTIENMVSNTYKKKNGKKNANTYPTFDESLVKDRINTSNDIVVNDNDLTNDNHNSNIMRNMNTFVQNNSIPSNMVASSSVFLSGSFVFLLLIILSVLGGIAFFYREKIKMFINQIKEKYFETDTSIQSKTTEEDKVKDKIANDEKVDKKDKQDKQDKNKKTTTKNENKEKESNADNKNKKNKNGNTQVETNTSKEEKMYSENQNVKSNGFCYIGTDNNIRHCIEVYDGEICESGDVYNRIDKCLAPQRFS